jgi:solute carrier family 35 protein E3
MSSVLSAALLNIGASVSIILTNKQLVSGLDFHFILLTLCLNFATTSLFCSTLAWVGWFEPKSLPARDTWGIAFLAVVTVLFNNSSVEANSVGFYQIFKLLIIPTVMCLEWVHGYKRTYSWQIITSLVISSAGVGMASISDVQFNARGFVLACLSDLVTAQFQIWQSGKQAEHGLTSTQIQYAVAYQQTFIAACGTLALDVWLPAAKGLLLLRPGGLLEYNWQGLEICWLGACCGIAVVMNLSTYALLGKTSPVTYQVIGQLKTCLTVGFGYLFFDHRGPEVSTAWLIFRFVGVLVGSAGILAYGLIKTSESKPQTSNGGGNGCHDSKENGKVKAT